jgi:CHAT domain-containing protein
MIKGCIVQFGLLSCAGALTLIAFTQSIHAATHEQIVERCKEAARPRVVACVRGKGGNPQSQDIIAACRQAVGRPLVVACVRREEQRQAAGKPAPAIPKNETAEALHDVLSVRPVFVAPPRTIADITAILDAEKPDEAKIAELKAKADASPPNNGSRSELAQFYYDRGAARAVLSRDKDALSDGLEALKVGTNAIDFNLLTRIRQLVAIQYRISGDPKQAIAIYEREVREANQPGRRGAMIVALSGIANGLFFMGDVDHAMTYARRVEALVQEARGSPNPAWREAYAIYGNYWEAEADKARALVFRAHGQYAEAEAAYRRAEAFHRAGLKQLGKYAVKVPPEWITEHADLDLLRAAYMEGKQGRLTESEADARRALLETLQHRGKYNSATPPFIRGLAMVLVEEGRYVEAEKLARSALDIQHTLGIGDDSSESARLLSQLANILVLERNTKEAHAVYAQLDRAIAEWPPERREAFELSGSRIVALYASGQINAGIAVAEKLVKQEAARTGAVSFNTALASGILAIGYARAGRDADAIEEFKAAIPILIAAESENADDDDPTLAVARRSRLQRIVEVYIDLLARDTQDSADVAEQTFMLADAVRGRAVQQSLAASSARLVAKDSALAALVRRAQDLGKQIGAALGIVNNMLALPSDQRDDQKVHAVSEEVEKLRADRRMVQQEIKRRFPSYSDLIDPKAPSVDEIQAALRPGEALLSFYFGQTASFVWAVPKYGPVAFAKLPMMALELSAKVHRLREALEPQVARVEEIPPFDLNLAYELYSLLLKPVEAGWKDAKSLIVVTNGALGELPLSLLPTARSQIDTNATPLFSGYRSVPWLARTHTVSEIPAASALITLRRLPPGSPQRETLIGFGDPYFNQEEAAEAESQSVAASAQVASESTTGADAEATMRGASLILRASPHTEEIDKAELEMLPRLPDTREELIAMAHALGVDPEMALYLGKGANEQNVETLDLSHYRIIAFATHGLVPGDLDGLTQPALALTAPEVAGVPGDGLLTTEKIMALKLNADWVVLSACNTAAGAGAGAQAVSGLGSAFFYAGTRALLVTNWSVHSASARQLISELFQRQGEHPRLSRAEALRQAMMALLDGPGFVDRSGHTLYSYAHPLFWAPYSVIGDGGGN